MAEPIARPAGGGSIAVVLKGYPRLSETFVAQELLALERRGFSLALFSLRRPTDRATHPLHAQIKARVTYLPEYLHHGPLRVFRAWRRARRLPGYAHAFSAWRRDLLRDRTRGRARRFGQALVLACELPSDVVHLHAHFLHTPASVARYAAMLRGLGWSVSAHAKDIWTTPEWEKREKLAECRWVATCTLCNATHLRELAPQAESVDLVYHGIDIARFPAPIHTRSSADGRNPRSPVTLLAVGRAVDKKGFDDLLRALARLPREQHWQLLHVGDGPRLPMLERLSRELGIAERIRWLGAHAHAVVLGAYRAADVFVLPSRIAHDGDRDGLPNVLLEAQSQRVACVSTSVSGIPELIVDGVTGLLVPPRAPDDLAAALSRLIGDPKLRQTLGDAGFERTTTLFSLDGGADRLAQRFASCLARS
ncbi:MAG TPA: glycosyltransferase family 4 protein [Casimicrobiaceae bacterium]|jgi:glycosyltransferase involved in cell wall biosynthesis|nr:glycosyltransferase family 4 protein [Casimicrobiaceae bacterium]